jgi:hypothetical protein
MKGNYYGTGIQMYRKDNAENSDILKKIKISRWYEREPGRGERFF